eukprot:g67058.t1
MSSPHAPTNIDIVSNNSSSSVVNSEFKRWATAARHEITIGGHDTATPIFQSLILQPLVFLDKLTTLSIKCFSLHRVWANNFGTTGCSSMRPTSRIVQLPRQTSFMIPTDLAISERMCRRPSLRGMLDSTDTRLMTLFTTTSAALSIARRPLTDPHRMALAMIAGADRPRPVAVSTSSPTVSTSSPTSHNSSDAIRSICIACTLPIEPTLVIICTICNSALHNGQTCICPCTGTQREMQSPAETIAYSDSDDGEPHLTCNGCNRPINADDGVASHWRCLLSAFTMDEKFPLCRGEVEQLRDLHTGAIANNDNVPNPPANSYQIDQLTMDLINALERPEMYVEGDPLPTDDHFSTPASSVPISSASSVLDTTSSTVPGPASCVVRPSTTNIVVLSSDVNRQASSSGMSEVAPSSDMSGPD